MYTAWHLGPGIKKNLTQGIRMEYIKVQELYLEEENLSSFDYFATDDEI